jgi:dolichol-phosphate mannosyltransferase
LHTYNISIVIACYNEAPHLEDSVGKIQSVMGQTKYTYELIFVDDFSQDETRLIIKKLVSANKHNMSYIFHDKNLGRGGAVTTGFRHANGSVIGFIDIDLEVHARYIPTMILGIENGNDIATAARIYKLDFAKLLRHFLSNSYRRFSRFFLGTNSRDTETGYKFFKRSALLSLLKKTTENGWFWDTEIMYWAEKMNYAIIEIPCLFIRRKDKKSTVKIWRDSLDYLICLRNFRKKNQ